MERNFETVMIEQCAPVLASLKPAGLFRYETRDCADLARRVKNWNEQLQPKGLRVRVLKGCARTHQYLVYVYRESMLRAVLTDETVQGFLRQEGGRGGGGGLSGSAEVCHVLAAVPSGAGV